MLLVFVLIEFAKNSIETNIPINNLNSPDSNFYSLITSIFLLNSIKLFNITDVSWNIPSWSISAEMISHLAYAATLLLINKYNLNKYKLIVFTTVIIISVIVLISSTNTYSFYVWI
jgi:peptidoglycan/LPS O-acetylase OafA/YrhL